MTQYDKELEELRNQIARKTRLENMIKDLKKQRLEISDKVSELEQIAEKEQSDVDRLNGRSLASFYYNVIGKKDSMLDKERQEAYAAKVKFDTALSELQALEADIQRNESELRSITRSEERYQQVLQEKAEFLKNSANTDSEKILEFENKLTRLDSQLTEIQEAITAGNCALRTIDHMNSHLDDAEGWGTWDMLGGGLISGMAKHDALDKAQDLVENLQIELRRFKAELADVSTHTDLQLRIDGFMRFADFFFDGLFTDWAVMDRIEQSKKQVLDTRNQLTTALNELQKMRTITEQSRKTTKTELDNYIYEL